MWGDSGASSQDRSAIVGYSPIGGICTQNRYSIIEETGGFRTVTVSYLTITPISFFIKFYFFYSIKVVAHELGHNLGSYHDGLTTDPFAINCPASLNYIMTPGIGVYTTNVLNFFKFSSCSVAAFKNNLLFSK